MPSNTLLISTYIAFIWLVVLHTFEEIASGIMYAQIGPVKLTPNKYLLGASLISTINLLILALLINGISVGYYLGLFTSAVIGVFQAIVHTIGFLKENKTARRLGAGFYSSIPLAIAGLVVFIQLVQIITS